MDQKIRRLRRDWQMATPRPLPLGSWKRLFLDFLPTADPGLHYALRSSYHDSPAIEAHGDQILDVFVRLASDAEWRKWLRAAVQLAAAAGDLSVFHRLFAACPRDSEFWTHETSRLLLAFAAEGGNVEIFSSLRDVCPSDPQFWTHRAGLQLLASAAGGGNVEIFSSVHALYRSDWEFWKENATFLLLHSAAHGGNLEIFATVLALCPSAEVWTLGRFFSLVCEAVSGGSFEMFSCVLAIDGFPSLSEVECDRGKIRILLDRTARGGSVDILLALLEVDGFLAEVCDDSESDSRPMLMCALYTAAARGHLSFVAALIDAGAPLERKCRLMGTIRDTALSAAVSNGHEEVVRELLAAGASISNAREANMAPGQNLLSVAASQNKEGTIDDLVAAGADLGKDRGECLPLHVAAKEGFCRPLKRLLLAGAKVDCVDRVGRSALHVACFYNHEGSVEVLLRHHASTSLLCDEGLSPCEVVAADALERRQRRSMSLCSNLRRPSTLNTVETAVADRIYGILQRASCWGRRGWLVVMRARYLDAEQVLGASMSQLSLSTTQSNEGQGESLYDGLAARKIDHDCSPPAAGRRTSAAADAISKSTTSPGGHCQEPRESAGPDMMTEVSGRGWKGAVVWLLQCPDECGVFRDVLSFL